MRIITNILPFILWLSLLLTAGGCGSRASEPEIEDPAGRAPKIFVTFNVALQKTPAATRADGQTWEDNDPLKREDGNEFDCKILPFNFSAAIYRANGELAGTIKQLSQSRSVDNFSTHVLSFTGLLDTEITGDEFERSGPNDFKIMIFANLPNHFDPAPSTAEGATETAVDKADKLDFSLKGKAGDFEAIPMWGVKAVTMKNLMSTETYDESKLNNLGTVYLLRAMAMVRVMWGDKVKDKANFVKFELNRHNGSGYTLPASWNDSTDTKKIELAKTIREKKDENQQKMTVTADPTKSMKYQGKDFTEEKFIQFYLPEIDNTTTESDEVTLTVTYQLNGEETPREGVIKFRNYEEGVPKAGEGPYDIVRNHIYEFIITQIGSDGIELNAAVRDWRIIRYEYYY